MYGIMFAGSPSLIIRLKLKYVPLYYFLYLDRAREGRSQRAGHPDVRAPGGG